MIDIKGPGAVDKVQKELDAILRSNPRGFSGYCISRIVMRNEDVDVKMLSIKKQEADFLAERAKFFRELLENRILGRKIKISFTRDSFS
jgi:hypothetical protein